MTPHPSSFSANLLTDTVTNSVTVAVNGEFESANVAAFEAATVRAADLGPSMVIVDLTGATLIDSAAIGAIMRFRQRLFDVGSAFTIEAPRPFQIRLFEIIGLSHLLAANTEE